MPSQAKVETDDGSNTCWTVVEMWNSNLKKSKHTSFHWGASPTDANKAGVARFLPYVLQGGCWDANNIDGSKTKAGETYTGFANVQHGSACRGMPHRRTTRPRQPLCWTVEAK